MKIADVRYRYNSSHESPNIAIKIKYNLCFCDKIENKTFHLLDISLIFIFHFTKVDNYTAYFEKEINERLYLFIFALNLYFTKMLLKSEALYSFSRNIMDSNTGNIL